MPRPHIRSLVAALDDVIRKFREEHADVLAETGPLELTIESDRHTTTWDPRRVYDSHAPAAIRYQP